MNTQDGVRSESIETFDCISCESDIATKAIAHESDLSRPVGYFCAGCYRSWVSSTEPGEGCVICGEPREYYTVREIEDLDGETMYVKGRIGCCGGHAQEYDGINVVIGAKKAVE